MYPKLDRGKKKRKGKKQIKVKAKTIKKNCIPNKRNVSKDDLI